jgi:hypothetical protein
MNPRTASSVTTRLLSFPSVTGAAGTIGALLAAGPAHAQAANVAAQLPASADLPAWVAPFMPVIVGAVAGVGGATLAWVLRTIFGTTIAALAAALDAAGLAIETKAKRTADPNDDAPASALAAALRAAAGSLRKAEQTMPGQKGGE